MTSHPDNFASCLVPFPAAYTIAFQHLNCTYKHELRHLLQALCLVVFLTLPLGPIDMSFIRRCADTSILQFGIRDAMTQTHPDLSSLYRLEASWKGSSPSTTLKLSAAREFMTALALLPGAWVIMRARHALTHSLPFSLPLVRPSGLSSSIPSQVMTSPLCC